MHFFICAIPKISLSPQVACSQLEQEPKASCLMVLIFLRHPINQNLTSFPVHNYVKQSHSFCSLKFDDFRCLYLSEINSVVCPSVPTAVQPLRANYCLTKYTDEVLTQSWFSNWKKSSRQIWKAPGFLVTPWHGWCPSKIWHAKFLVFLENRTKQENTNEKYHKTIILKMRPQVEGWTAYLLN